MSSDDSKPSVSISRSKLSEESNSKRKVESESEEDVKPIKKKKPVVVVKKTTTTVAKKVVVPKPKASGSGTGRHFATSAVSSGGQSNIGVTYDPGEGQKSFTLTKPQPTRDPITKIFHFPDYPTFLPNVSPCEIIRQGSFGGGYFRKITSAEGKVCDQDWSDMPKEWYEGIDVAKYMTSIKYDVKLNKWGVKCGQSYDEWEKSGWFELDHDARGWCHWYGRFWMGRRCPDDARQLDRWKKCTDQRSGRWVRNFYGKYITKGVQEISPISETISPVIRSVLFTWGYEANTVDLHRFMKEKGVAIN